MTFIVFICGIVIGFGVGRFIRIVPEQESQTPEEKAAAIRAFKFCPKCSCAWAQHLRHFYTGVYKCAKCGCREVPPPKEEGA